MPTPNYSFEKRKRELAKKAAKEAKRLRKEEAKTSPTAGESPDAATAETGTSADVTEPPATGESAV
jgi:hypothetical protein